MGRKPPTYAGKRIHALRQFEGGLPHRMVELYNPALGKKREVACSYEVLVGGQWVELCRYDSYHEAFHRHRAHWPKRTTRARDGQIDLRFKDVPVKRRAEVALEDIKQHARAWQRLIPREEVQRREASTAV